jgi:hypothetical protein
VGYPEAQLALADLRANLCNFLHFLLHLRLR